MIAQEGINRPVQERPGRGPCRQDLRAEAGMGVDRRDDEVEALLHYLRTLQLALFHTKERPGSVPLGGIACGGVWRACSPQG